MLKTDDIVEQLDEAIRKAEINVDINPEFAPIKMAAIDVEHDESGGFVGCGLYSGNGIVSYYSDLLYLCRVPFHGINLIGHNGITDIECLQSWGINIEYSQLIWDTMIIGHIIDSSQKDYSLKGMAKKELAISYPTYDDIVGKRGQKAERITLDKQSVELVSKYNALDCYTTWKLYERQRKNVPL